MKNTWGVVAIALALLITQISSYKILFLLPFGSKSHRFAFDAVGLEMAKRGHEATFFSGVTTIKNSSNVINIYSPEINNVMENSNISFFDGKATDSKFLARLLSMVRDLTTLTYTQPFVADIIKTPLDKQNHPKYDLVVIDTVFNEFTLPLAQRLGVPAVYLSPGGLMGPHAWSLNIPYPYSYIPSPGSNYEVPMGFYTRMCNAFMNVAFNIFREWSLLPSLDEVIREYYPEARSIKELEKEVAFLMTNSHFSVNNVIPTMPYFVEVGGLNLVEAKKLPKELEDFMESSGEHGVIYFSLGSVTKGDSMPLEMRAKVIKAFEKIPQKVLWKYEQDIPDLPKNVKLTKWAPQQDLLGHPKIRAFITHCGGMSTFEAAYHACPIIGFPLSADQDGNMVLATGKGFGQHLDWRTFASDDLVQAIKNAVNDKRYREAASRISVLMKDRPQPPVETAAYWLEYVIRHKGAPHLKSGAENLNFFQYFLLDVIGAIAAVVFIVLSVACFILKKLFGLCGINICPINFCRKFCPIGCCSKACPADSRSPAKVASHKKKN